jgi:hypothetical protein
VLIQAPGSGHVNHPKDDGCVGPAGTRGGLSGESCPSVGRGGSGRWWPPTNGRGGEDQVDGRATLEGMGGMGRALETGVKSAMRSPGIIATIRSEPALRLMERR